MNKNVLFILLISLLSITLYAQSLGDVSDDGVIDIVDALLVAQYYVGLNPVGFINSGMADVNCDSVADIVDALLIAQLYVGLLSQFDCPEPTPGTVSGNFTWAVIVDLDSEPVTQAQAQELVDQASDILMELTGFTYTMVDFTESTSPDTVSELAVSYIENHADDLPNGIIIFSYGDNDQARIYGGYALRLDGPADYRNTFNSPVVGNNQVYVSVQHWSHRYAPCGYGSVTEEEPLQDTSFNGECRNQDGIPCVEQFGYMMCSSMIDTLYASSRTYFGSSVIIHETMHSFGYEGVYDHYGTDECGVYMTSGISDRPYDPDTTDLYEFQYYNGMCPYVYDNFVSSYEP